VSVVELSDDQRQIQKMVREFVEQEVYPVAEELEARDEFPDKIVERSRRSSAGREWT
jgi:alkylation response protein AidB-like acyl-CoA dehydrogenase